MPSNPQPIARRPAVFAAFALLALFVSIAPRPAFGQDQPTVVSNLKVEPNPFSPNGDGINESAKFSFSISDSSQVTIEILFFTDKVIVGRDTDRDTLFNGNSHRDSLILGDSKKYFASDTIIPASTAAAGLNEFVWNGKIRTLVITDSNLLPDSLYPDSTYTYLIRTKNLSSSKITKVTGQVTVDKKPPVISSVSAGPNPFSPNNDGINDVTKIKFSLTGLPHNASLGRLGFKTTFNAATNQYDVVSDPANTDSSGFFDGGSDSVLVPFAPIELQFIKRSANQGAISFNVRGRRVLDSGDLVLVISGTITINPADPVGTSYRDPNGTLFSVIDQASVVGGTSTVSESNTVEVRTSSGAVKVEVRDSQSALVDTSLSLDPPFIGNGTYSAGFGSTTLHPRLDDGNYTYNIVAADESGNVAQISGTVTAVSTPISISGLQANPDTISPADANNRFDFSTISYSLNRDARVTLQIFRDSTAFVSNNLVRTVFSNQSQTDGPHNLTWDGKNDTGGYVSPGAEKTYRIIVFAFDPLTSETIEARTQVFVDNKKPDTISISRIPSRTSEASLKLSGRASVGDSVVLFVNSEFKARPLLNEFGTFDTTVALGADGFKRLFAHAFDKVWNGPTVSDTQSFTLDTKPPAIVDTLIRVGGQPRSLEAIPPLTKITSRDTIVVRLQDDKEAGVYSGLDLQKTIVRLFRPSGSEVQGNPPLFAVPDTVRFVITDSLGPPGIYELRVTSYDSLSNQGVESVRFNLGAQSPSPSLVSVTNNPNRNGFFNSRLDNQADWTFTVTLADNSGTGIDTAGSTLKLVFMGTGKEMEIVGNLTKTANTLTFATTEKIATDGTGDGLYVLQITANDNDPTSDSLTASAAFINDTRPPDTTAVAFVGDTSQVRLTLADLPAVAGVAVSGLDLGGTVIAVSGPDGQALPAVTTHDGKNTVTVAFEGGKPSAAGNYTIAATLRDLAENTRNRLISFPLNVTGSPAPGLVGVTINSTRNGFFNSRLDNQADWTFTVTLADNSGTGIDTAHSTLKLVFESTVREVGGSLTKAANTLTFTTSEKIATDGTGDGLYVLQITANDNDPTSDSLTASAAFINDTRPPDTTSFFADANLVRATLSDPGTFHSGVDIVNSKIEVRNAALQLIPGQLTNDGLSALYFTFNQPLVATGVYTVKVIALDRAENPDTISRLFVVGGISLKPAVTLYPGLPTVFPFQTALRAQALTQPLVVRIQVTDVSLSGINWDSTRARILRPDSTEFTMTSSRSDNLLTLTASSLLSNSGTDDGLYSLAIHIADNSPATADLDTSFYFIFDNRAPDTTAVAFVGDTSQVRLTLADQPAVAGVATAGLDLVGTVIAVTGADGQAVPATTTHDGKNSVNVAFEGGKPSAAGIYTIAATLRDFAGNTRNRSISFPLNVTGRIDFYPPDSSIVTGPLSRVKAWVTGASGGVAPGPAADLTVTRSAQTVPGAKSTAGDSLLYAFTDTLTTSGADDGRYEMRAGVDIANLGSRANKTGFFVFDNTPPDTQSVTVTLTDQAATAVVVFTDGGFYPEVAGIDPGRSSAVFEDPRGQTIQPADTAWLDNERLQATFGRLEATGLHYLRLTVADRAGHIATLRKPVINNLGIVPGSSTSIVEDVPARTVARIKFYSGHSGRTITRAVIRIFNLRGDLVRRLDVTDRIEAGGASVSAEWLLENDSGSLVTNGVFIYYWEVTYNDGSTDRIRKTLAVARR
ncbi:MAG: hypothetical protein V1794_04105 [Candidatus Glassbacteria bacterium]